MGLPLYMRANNKFFILLVVAIGAFYSLGANSEETITDNSLLPMYGGLVKNQEQMSADQKFLDQILATGSSRDEASLEVEKLGWQYFWDGDLDTAIKRFNQAWMLNAENSGTYKGFAIVQAERGAPVLEVVNLFEKSIAKANADSSAYVDYGRYLWTIGRFQDSLSMLERALDKFPNAYNASSNMAFVYYRIADYAKACYWSKQAEENQEKLEPGFLQDMCSRSGGKDEQ